MKIQAIISLTALLSIFPLCANAQGYNNNININLNDVMVGQRMQEMSQKLNDVNASSIFKVKRHNPKHEKKNKVQRAALLPTTDGEKMTNDDSAVTTPISESANVQSVFVQ